MALDLDYFAGAAGCSLVAPDLTSTVSGAVPTFSFARSRYDATLAFEVTWMSGDKTCYHPPMFTPVIVNTEASYTETCYFNVWSYDNYQYSSMLCDKAQVTAIPDGRLTISHTGALLDGRKPPIPYVVTIGPSPSPTAKETATITSTSTTVSTFTTWGGYRSTHTDYSYVATWTREILVPASETTTRTHYVTACPAKPAASPPPPPPGTLLNKCDEDNGKIVYTDVGPFEITCGFELDVKTSGRMQSKNGMLGCIDLCVATKGCTAMVFFEALDDCYLKFGRGTANKNIFAAGAELKGKRQPLDPVVDTTVSPRIVPRRGGPHTVWDPYPSSNETSAPALPTKQPFALGNGPDTLLTSYLPDGGTRAVSRRDGLMPAFSVPMRPNPHPHLLSNRWAACPGDHRKMFIAFNAAFLIVCGYDRSGITTGPFPTIGLNECIRLCSSTEDCVFSSFRHKTSECYLKFGHGDVHINPDSYGAQLRALLPDVESTPPLDPLSSLAPGRIEHFPPFDVPTSLSMSGLPRVTKVPPPKKPSSSKPLSSSSSSSSPSSSSPSLPSSSSSSSVEVIPPPASSKPPPPSSSSSSSSAVIIKSPPHPPPPALAPAPQQPPMTSPTPLHAPPPQSRTLPTDGRPPATPTPSTRLSRHEARGFHLEAYQGRGPDFTFIPDLTIATSTVTATSTMYTTTTIAPWWQILGTTTTILTTKSVTRWGWLMNQVRTITLETSVTFCPRFTDAAAVSNARGLDGGGLAEEVASTTTAAAAV